MAELLNITDGTTTINLLNITDGYRVDGWRQAIAQYKGGGTWQNSALADGRRLVDKHWGNIQNVYPLVIKDELQDATIRAFRDLIMLLEKASDYWVYAWQDDPVWIERRAAHETSTGYSIIGMGSIPQLNDLYATPFLEDAVMEELTLQVEQGCWIGNQPGVGTAIEGALTNTYDGRTYGNVDDSEIADPVEEVYIQNWEILANLTDIYVDDGGVFGGNLLDAALPYNLLPAVPAVGDAVYFGIDNASASQTAFMNLIFDLSIAQNDCTIVWEYSNIGGGWTTIFYIQDNTNAAGAMTGDPFDTTGVNGMFHGTQWPPATAGWRGDLTVVNGITAYWIRARVTAVGAAPSPPQQANRNVYTIPGSHIDFAADQFFGDIPNIAKFEITTLADRDGPGGTGADAWDEMIQRAIVGTRQISRGSDFRAFINISDVNIPSGLTLTDVGPGAWQTLSTVGSPGGGRAYQWTTAIVVAMTDLVTITFSPALAAQYYGRYHVWARTMHTTGGGQRFNLQLKVQSGSGGVLTTQPVSASVDRPTFATGQLAAIDLGVINIPAAEIVAQTETFDEVVLTIRGEHPGTTSDDIWLVDLILMPVDEWAGDFQDRALTADSTVETGRYLDIDSITRPKTGTRALVRETTTDQIVGIYQSIAPEPCQIRHSGAQRLHFLTMFSYGSGPYWGSDYINANKVKVSIVPRFLGPIGAS
jgi:hypothetical protein